MPLITIIIPVYNAARFVQHTIDSLRNQTLCDFEALLLDDGSEDQSVAICEAASALDSRFRTIRLPHGGVSAARNAGIAVAQGQYTTFVDSDDWVEPQFLEAFFSTPLPDPTQNDRVVVIQDMLLDYSQAPEPHPANSRVFNYAGATLERTDGNNTQRASQQQFLLDGYTSGKLYVTTLLHRHNLHFPEDMTLCEDHIFMLNVMRYADTVIWLPVAYLHYMYRGLFNRSLSARIYPARDYIRIAELLSAGFEIIFERFGVSQCPHTISLQRSHILCNYMNACRNLDSKNYQQILSLMTSNRVLLRQFNYKLRPCQIIKPWLLQTLCYLPKSLYFLVYGLVRIRIYRKKLREKCSGKK